MGDFFIGLCLLILACALLIPLIGVVWILFAELWDDYKKERERKWKREQGIK